LSDRRFSNGKPVIVIEGGLGQPKEEVETSLFPEEYLALGLVGMKPVDERLEPDWIKLSEYLLSFVAKYGNKDLFFGKLIDLLGEDEDDA
jgi:hypothetical protein